MKNRTVLFLIGLAAVYPAVSATFTVNSTADLVDKSPGNYVCLASNGKCTLRAAIMEANSTPAVIDTVVIPTGTFVLSLGQLAITSSMTVRGSSSAMSIVDGGGKFRVFDIAAGKAVQLRTLTVRNGYIQDRLDGGGCIRNAGQLTLNTVIVTSCRLRTENGKGGGIYNYGKLTIQGSQITNNKVEGILSDGNFFFGVGIANSCAPGHDEGPNCGQLTMMRTLVSGNQALTSGSGVGLSSNSYTDAQITDSTFRNNSGDMVQGGAIYTAGTLKLVRSTLNANSSFEGGGLWFYKGAHVTVTNSTISGNVASTDSGGIYWQGDLSIQNSTITGNRAPSGGGIGAGSEPQHFSLMNSIVAGNTAVNGPDCPGFWTSPYNSSLNYSLIGNTSGCHIPARGVGNLLNRKPVLGLLADNGGKTKTHALLVGSPAINAASPQAPGSGGSSCETVDQRGVVRPQSGRCDMGAYERRPETPHGPEVSDEGAEIDAEP